MTPRKRKSRVYWRNQGGTLRAYFDGRDYRDVGGRREPLMAPGEAFATTDPDVATRLAGERLTELEAARRRRAFHGDTAAPALADFARLHLIAKKRAGTVTDAWLDATQQFLARAIAFFGVERELDTIRVSDVRRWVAHLGTTPARPPRTEGEPPGRPMTAATVRHHLNALSNLYRRAMEDELVLPGYNPVAALMEKPGRSEHEARWLEVPDAALLLAAAAGLPPVATPAGEAIGAELAYPLVATFLLTAGARRRCSDSSWTTCPSIVASSRFGRTPGAGSRPGPRTASSRSGRSSAISSARTCSAHGSSARAGSCSRPSWTAASRC